MIKIEATTGPRWRAVRIIGFNPDTVNRVTRLAFQKEARINDPRRSMLWFTAATPCYERRDHDGHPAYVATLHHREY